MEWKEIQSEKKWVLQDNGDIAAIIQLIDKDDIINKYQTKTSLSAIYLGKRRFTLLEKRKRDWLSSRKKFSSEALRAKYIESKKKALLRYIEIRIS